MLPRKQHHVEILGEVRPATVVVVALANGTLWIGVDPPENRLYCYPFYRLIFAFTGNECDIQAEVIREEILPFSRLVSQKEPAT